MISESKLPIQAACETLGVRRTSYYRDNCMALDKAKVDDPALIRKIENIVKTFSGYGYKRVTKELQRQSHIINHKRTYRIMSENNLLVRKKRKFKIVTTDSNHNLPVYKNLIKNLEVTRLNQVWVADLTYILLAKGHIYLAAILDIFSRRCIGWALSDSIDTDLALSALNMAIRKRRHMGLSGLIHHSDQGVQYASKAYVNCLNELNIRISMSRKGNPYDNAHIESFFKTFKIEEAYIKEYGTFEDAVKNIRRFIEVLYNKKRIHSGIGYRPPEEYEKEVLNIRVVR